MKNIKATIPIISLFVLMSCSKDDVPIINEITYDGETYTTTNGLVLDYGVVDETHYNFDFFISDGKISLDGSQLDLDESVTYYVSAALASFGSENFLPGEFAYNSSFQLVDRSIFISPKVFVKGDAGFALSIGTGGSITVSGTSPNYTIMYDLIIQDKLLTGSFTGTFDIQNGPS